MSEKGRTLPKRVEMLHVNLNGRTLVFLPFTWIDRPDRDTIRIPNRTWQLSAVVTATPPGPAASAREVVRVTVRVWSAGFFWVGSHTLYLRTVRRTDGESGWV